ncbi:putative dehydrogenase [Parabacteroides sp. PFB2-10]|uniref:Gfo/Idh/MocA family protein n=1 Tax=Parabacteroides sp. PFB2-10 TaxID=1742405 RepID=UPI0024749461|nr:Gfo/Idh/MocA family oxidoreductase [Parabacteroides sp. PFB2-10]MDH6311975.1 putative dehydrogenase [Parabacteroides sp. PFB2-10]MDL2245216.1 Gfo/Idh/MocA family oxidoreductase [Parabacteroides sp. OttesenSCG-928-J18]
MKNQSKKVSRRDFLGMSALGLAGLTILPSWTINGVRMAPSDRVVLGFIGLGRQSISDFNSFKNCPGIQVVAGCDVDSIKRDRFKKVVGEWQKSINMPERCDQYEFYEELLERKDIDAISIATPDHWHALNVIHSCQSGKDVYCQKPLSYTITESMAMVKAVRDNNCILQVGSQQRSSKEFQQAIALVRSGAIGAISKIYVRIGEPPAPFNLKEEPVPPHMNFNQWLGPLNSPVVHFNSTMCPQISYPDLREKGEWATWRYYRETGNGFTGDWGAHHFDIAQAAIGMDGLGPEEFIPAGYNGTKYATLKYGNGIVMTEQPFREDSEHAKGIQFIGSKGWIKVARGYIECSDSSLLKKSEQKIGEGVFEMSSPHMQDFIDSVRSRRDPIAPVEVGSSTNILCCLLNIAYELGRPVKWNPATQRFIDDKEAEAHRLYWYEYRKPYTLPYWK